MAVQRFGQANGAGDVDALFLKLFAGEVITAFEQKNVALKHTLVRTISNGKSASFPTHGRTVAAYHTPGNVIAGDTLNVAETVITIDDLLTASHWIANIDEAKAHYDYRSIHTTEIGRALANQMDKHILQMGVLAARSANTVTGMPGGSQIGTNTAGAPASANFLTNGEHLADAMFLAAQVLDEKEIPEDDRVAFVRPAQYYALVKAVRNINRDWGGSGSFADGNIVKVAGIEIVATNSLPRTDMSAVTGAAAGTNNRYRGNFANTSALVIQKSALATVKLLDLAIETEYSAERQATFTVGKYAVGHGVLRPEASIEIVNAIV